MPLNPIAGRKPQHFACLLNRDHLEAMELVSLAGVKIRRHVKVRADFNPFDPTWEPYAEQRRLATMSDKLGYRQQVLSLARRQEGLCAHCSAPITWESGWHDHHVVLRSHAGSNALDNRVLVHPNSHSRIHYAGFRGEARYIEQARIR